MPKTFEHRHDSVAAGPGAPSDRRPVAGRLVWFLIVATPVLIGLVAATHYYFNRTVPTRLLQQFAEQVQPRVDQLGHFPDPASWVPEAWEGRLTHLADEPTRAYARQTGSPVIAAAGPMHAPCLRKGRPVLLYQQQRFSVIWLSEVAFEARMQQQQADVTAFHRGEKTSQSAI